MKSEPELVCDTSALLVDVTENGIYSADGGVLTHHLFSGEVVNTYKLASEDTEHRLIAVNESYCAFTVKDMETNDDLYILNFDSSEIVQLDGVYRNNAFEARIMHVQIYDGAKLHLIVRMNEYDCINDIYYYVPGNSNRSMYIKSNDKDNKKLVISTFPSSYSEYCYPENEYYDRLKMKLLSGEDDFDIYIINPEADWNILNSVLGYQVYEALENYEGISKNIGEMLDGTIDIMTQDGHIFGVPISVSQYYELGISKSAKEYGLPIPDIDWSDADFWELCEAYESRRSNGVYLCNDAVPLGILNHYIQSGIISGRIDKARVAEILVNITRYTKSGVIANEVSREMLSYEFKSMLLYGYYPNYTISDEEAPAGFIKTVKMPSVDGVSCMTVSGLMIANPKSKNKAAAAEFLELVTSKEVAANKSIFSHLNVYYENSVSDILNSLTKGRSVYMFNVTEVNAILNAPDDSGGAELIKKMVTGEMTPEEAADVICKHIQYRYFE